jgi:hypothetical protein
MSFKLPFKFSPLYPLWAENRWFSFEIGVTSSTNISFSIGAEPQGVEALHFCHIRLHLLFRPFGQTDEKTHGQRRISRGVQKVQ